MRDIWSFLLQTLTASGAAVLLLVVKAMFQDKLTPRWQFSAWSVLGMVLVLPAGLAGRYTLVNWPFYVELLRSALTGEYGALAQVTAPVPLPLEERPQTAEEWLFALYLLGAAFLLVRYLAGYVRLRLALHRGHPVENDQVRTVAEQYSLPVCPAVEVEGLPSAFVCGVFKPVLALPAGERTDEKVILHELLHLENRDILWGLVLCLFRCIHWCNPLLWYCANRAGNDLESLCDQRVLELLEGEARRDYGHILLAMSNERYARAPGTSSMANGGKNIRRRIVAIARFKKYPAGMGLVSVCIVLVLAASLAAGARAEVHNGGVAGFAAADLAYARTLPCTTCSGAFDAYAKALLAQRSDYRAMCAPLSEQNALAACYGTSPVWTWEEAGLPGQTRAGSGYVICNQFKVEPDVYEGVLAVELLGLPEQFPEDERQWLAYQTVRAEKEGERWVAIPQGEFQVVQGKLTDGLNKALPCRTYETKYQDFTLRVKWQSRNTTVDFSDGNPSFSKAPQPNTSTFPHYFGEMTAVYTGSPERKGQYVSIGVCAAPDYEDWNRPALWAPREPDGEGMNEGDGTGWGSKTLNGDWAETLTLFCGQSTGGRWNQIPDSYAADLYLNGEKAAELALLPLEGGD